MSDIKLKHIAASNIPEFVRDNYPVFASFLAAYHDWLEAFQPDISNLTDLDTTLEEFIKHFKGEVDNTGVEFPNIDDSMLLRHIKNLYLSKGTPESYRTLFRLMYNKDVFIKYPEQLAVKASDGKWEQIYSIFVQTDADASVINNKIVKCKSSVMNRTIDLTINNVKLRREGGSVTAIRLTSGGANYGSDTIVQLIGGGGEGATAHVEIEAPTPLIDINAVGGAIDDGGLNNSSIGTSATPYSATSTGVITRIVVDNGGTGYTSPPTVVLVSKTGTGAQIGQVIMYSTPKIYECEIDRNYYGSIDIGDEVYLGTEFSGKVIPTINSFEVLDPGKNFRVGQTFEVDTMFGSGAIVKVTKLGTDKGIAELKFIKFGFGYVSDFISENLIPPNTSQSIPAEGFAGLDGTFHEYSYADPVGGYILDETWSQADANGLYGVDYAGDTLREFYSYNKYKGDPANRARISFKLGAICKYPGHYVNADGMASDDVKLTDSRWYQKYAIVIQADERLDTYKDIVKSFVHPAGVALYGEYNIRNDFNVKIQLDALFSIFNIRHADATTVTEDHIYYEEKIINDDTVGRRGMDLDHVLTSELKIYYLLKVINDESNGALGAPLDVIDPNSPASQTVVSPSQPYGGVRQVYDFPWVANSTFNLGDILINGSNYYKVVVAGTAGLFAPTHTTGTVTNGTLELECIGTWDGMADILFYELFKYAKGDRTIPATTLDGNLLRSSNVNDVRNWGAGNMTRAAALAPDGTMTACLRTTINASQWSATYMGGVTIIDDLAHTVSIYWQPGTATAVTWGLYDNKLGWNGGTLYKFNSLTSTAARVAGAVTTNSATITNLGTGFWRLTITISDMTPENVHSVYIYSDNSAASAAGLTDTVWGVKMDYGSVATPYTGFELQNDVLLDNAGLHELTNLERTDLWTEKVRDVLIEPNGYLEDTAAVEPTDVWYEKTRLTGLNSSGSTNHASLSEVTALEPTDLWTEKVRDTFLANNFFKDYSQLAATDITTDKIRDILLANNFFKDITSLEAIDNIATKAKAITLDNDAFSDASSLEPTDLWYEKSRWLDLVPNGYLDDAAIANFLSLAWEFTRPVYDTQNGQTVVSSTQMDNKNIGAALVTATHTIPLSAGAKTLTIESGNIAVLPYKPSSVDHGIADWYCFEQATVTYSIPDIGVTIYQRDTTGKVTTLAHSSVGPLNGNFTAYQGYTYYSDGPVSLVPQGFHHRIAPYSMAGTTFIHYANRLASITLYFHAPYATTYVKVFVNGASGVNTETPTYETIVQHGDMATIVIPTLGWYYIVADNEIVCTATGATGDSTVVTPASQYVYNRYNQHIITTLGTSATAAGTSGAYSPALVGSITIADAAGGDCAQGLGLQHLGNSYSVGFALSDYVLGSVMAGTVIDVSYWNGTAWVILESHTLNGTTTAPEMVGRNGSSGPGINVAINTSGTISGTSAYFAGGATLWKWTSNNPFYLGINDTADDEFSVLGWDSARLSRTLNLTSNLTEDYYGFARLVIADGTGIGQAKTILQSRVNKLSWSNDFTNPVWIKTNTVVTPGQLDPFGGFNASVIAQTAAGYPNHGPQPAALDKVVFYAKPNATDWVCVTFKSYANGTETAWLNLASGTVGIVGSNVTASIVAAQNGYYKCQVAKKTATTSEFCIVTPVAANGAYSIGGESMFLYTVHLTDTDEDEPIVTGATSGIGLILDEPFTVIPDTLSSLEIYDRDNNNETQLFGLDSVSISGDGFRFYDNAAIEDYDINNSNPYNKPLYTTFESEYVDSTTPSDTGEVVLNLYMDPLNQYVQSGYVSAPITTF